MTEAARITGVALFGVAVVLLVAVHFVPFEERTYPSGEHVVATVWSLTDTVGGNATTHSWADFDSVTGLGLVRSGAPLLITATCIAAGGGVLLFFRRRIFGGVVGLIGAVVAGTFLTLMSAGLDDIATVLLVDAHRLPSPLHFSYGMFIAMGATLVLMVASVVAFIALLTDPEAKETVSDRPTLSVNDPNAFNPLASKEPRPFRADPPTDYKSFEVTGGPRTFKARTAPEPVKPAVDARKVRSSGLTTPGEMPPQRLQSPIASPAPVPWKGASQPAMPAKPATAAPAKPAAPKPAAPANKPSATPPRPAPAPRPAAPPARPAPGPAKPVAPAAKPAPGAKPAAKPATPAKK